MICVTLVPADPNGRNKSGVTALMLAVAEADAESARLLVKAGADAQATGSIGAADRITALHIAATIGNEPVALDIINLLLEAGARQALVSQRQRRCFVDVPNVDLTCHHVRLRDQAT